MTDAVVNLLHMSDMNGLLGTRLFLFFDIHSDNINIFNCQLKNKFI